ncbi:hypothetical protein [Thiomonas sp.]|uniref:hypothetical protein n=1 Tax=Thiomonas sp. TaxID=2047785 RepID=UPI002621D714|nr:hypothetical protein [Thiomonas sp.]
MLHVDKVFCSTLPQRQLGNAPRERFVLYQRDLHRMAKTSLTESTMAEGDRYSFTELGDSVLDGPACAGELRGVDLTIFSYWTPECDPEYSAFGPYFMERYRLQGHSFDVCDTGSLSASYALMVADRYLSCGSATRVLILGMEQTTIPRNESLGLPIPRRSSAIAALLTSAATPDSRWELLEAGQIDEWQVAAGLDSLGFVTALSMRHAADGEFVLLTQHPGHFAKVLKFQLETSHAEIRWHFAYFDPSVSGMHVFRFLAGETLEPLSQRTVLLVDHDVESLRLAWTAWRRH